MRGWLFIIFFFYAGAAAQAQDSIFLFSYFTGNGEDGLHLAYSKDGYHFTALHKGQPLLKPAVGKDRLMRDPCIIRGGDGQFHMVWTVGWQGQGIGYASSPDLIHWPVQKYIPVMEHEPAARNCWAPEITYDPEEGLYMIYWATTITGRFPETLAAGDDGYNHRIYYTTTRDFKNFSETKLLLEPGFNVIDATIQKSGNSYIMFLKNETRRPAEKNIRLAFAEELTGPYGAPGPPVTGNYWAEGPTAARLEDNWIVYFDKYVKGRMGAVVSEDLERWKDVSRRVRFPKGTRHGTIVKISGKEFETLKNANVSAPLKYSRHSRQSPPRLPGSFSAAPSAVAEPGKAVE
ncbi:glycosyl hydrolase family 43 [Anseongella ginsenosidimutans]|uniref:Glycosyl hydrolase family 43 n=1 Tax=Anseongella ginsenosidimutans TaxID=496056 RepID=A0A4R3KSD9_9SPHI|nr:glycoside hydrolase family 43 protein [Anseongella ginsenosidimutans]QEC53072.1 family 43 glycosylhydrolase [Anseongella ginsenosidimutans]TCS87686.1 glycosyl hydrolase family 43 [Anseongella ginsenosidimutans]